MQVINKFPPNFSDIIKVIPGAIQEGIVFTYGEAIYNPSKSTIEDHVMEHELIHIQQQKEMGADEWWTEYLKNPKFRLEQELEAYRIQYKFVSKKYGRAEATWVLKQIANDLSSPMYGNILNRKQARKEIMK